MRFADVLRLALSALWRQKTRSILTTLGVVFGSFVLAASLSVGQGVQDTIDRESRRATFLRQIEVRPGWERPAQAQDAGEVRGPMSDAKRRRIRQALAERKQRFEQRKPVVTLNRERLAELARLDHVEEVVPMIWRFGYAALDARGEPADIASVRPDDSRNRRLLLAGRFFDSPDERSVVVSEFLAYRWGVTDDEAVKGIVGKKIRLEFPANQPEAGIGVYLNRPAGEQPTRDETSALDKIRNQLPDALDKLDLTAAEKDALRRAIKGKPREAARPLVEEFTVVGVARLPEVGEQDGYDPLRVTADVLLPAGTATGLFFRLPGTGDQGVDRAVLVVDREENVKEVSRRVTEMGLHAYAAFEFVERQRLLYLMIFGAMTCVAAVALLVSALGIANTMLMSVLERTREIGLMKAVGAGDRGLQLLFLVEGALIGLVGGGLGLLLSWAASIPGDGWVRALVARDLKIELKESIFAFPPWLLLSVPAFALLVTTLAAVYPARRAARLDPVTALRHG